MGRRHEQPEGEEVADPIVAAIILRRQALPVVPAALGIPPQPIIITVVELPCRPDIGPAGVIGWPLPMAIVTAFAIGVRMSTGVAMIVTGMGRAPIALGLPMLWRLRLMSWGFGGALRRPGRLPALLGWRSDMPLLRRRLGATLLRRHFSVALLGCSLGVTLLGCRLGTALLGCCGRRPVVAAGRLALLLMMVIIGLGIGD